MEEKNYSCRQDLGFTGNTFVETPNMDRLARNGMRFSTAYSTHPFCSPTRHSLVSGRWPARTAWMKRSELDQPDAPCGAGPFAPMGVHTWSGIRPEFTSLAEVLKSRGYATAHIGKWHFELPGFDISPESEGFDFNFGGDSRVGAVRNHFSPFEGLPGNVKSHPGEYLMDRLTDETIGFIRKNKDRPFFVQLWHYAPHSPIQAPEAVEEKYRKKRARMGDPSLNPTYAAMIDCLDQGVGRILETLGELGLGENTVVLLTSDNGGVEFVGSIPVTSMAPMRGPRAGATRAESASRWPSIGWGIRNRVPEQTSPSA